MAFSCLAWERGAGVARRGLARLGLAVAAALGAAWPGASGAVEALQQLDVVLLQPGAVIEQRIAGGADALADYLKHLGEAASGAMQANPQQIPSAGFIVVAIRPEGRTHAWLDFKPELGPKATEALTRAVESVVPNTVKSGNVVFALRVSIWGARQPASYAPAPQAWRDAARLAGHKLDIDTLVDQVWPQ